jgi:hypothetical protein
VEHRSSDQHRNEVAVVQDVVFGTRENVNLVMELYRQGFLLPLQHSPTIRKILSLYRDWIHRKVITCHNEDNSSMNKDLRIQVEMPLFMLEPVDTRDDVGSKSREVFNNSASRDYAGICAGSQVDSV